MKKFIKLFDEVYVDYALLNCTPANYAITHVDGNKYASLSYLLMDKIDFEDYALEVKKDPFASENYYKIFIGAKQFTLKDLKRILNMFSEQPRVRFFVDENSTEQLINIELKFNALYVYENE